MQRQQSGRTITTMTNYLYQTVGHGAHEHWATSSSPTEMETRRFSHTHKAQIQSSQPIEVGDNGDNPRAYRLTLLITDSQHKLLHS